MDAIENLYAAAQTATVKARPGQDIPEHLELLDIEIAHQVFGLSREAIDAWPWGAPFFSSDRTAAADVVGHMLTGPDRQAFEQELEQAARHWGWGSTTDHAGTATLLLVLTPDEICRAALKALQQSGRAEPT